MASNFDLRSHLHKWGKAGCGSAVYVRQNVPVVCLPCADLQRPQLHQLGFFRPEFLRMQLARFVLS
jgi:hypothetical protein